MMKINATSDEFQRLCAAGAVCRTDLHWDGQHSVFIVFETFTGQRGVVQTVRKHPRRFRFETACLFLAACAIDSSVLSLAPLPPGLAEPAPETLRVQ